MDCRPTPELDSMLFEPEHGKNEIINRIEMLVDDIVTTLAGLKVTSITLPIRRRQITRRQHIISRRRERQAVSFPNASEQRAWRFTVILKILNHVHHALIDDVIVTKRCLSYIVERANFPSSTDPYLPSNLTRDIFYQDPELFIKQRVVDEWIEDLAFTLSVPRLSLNVIATAKGLVAGCFDVLQRNGTKLNGAAELGGLSIPAAASDWTLDMKDVTWILVIEKEATFAHLATSRYYQNSIKGKGMIVTGKGYPDVATRAFLHQLPINTLNYDAQSVPIYALVDHDPDGIYIMSVYKHGSLRLAHQSWWLNLPNLKWLGPKCQDVAKICEAVPPPHPGSETNISNGSDGWTILTRDKRKKAQKMLWNDHFAKESDCTRALQIMLLLNMSAEIQSLDNHVGGLAAWLDDNL
ncbi:hypothetical protein MMC25_004088 [Agyrium rufum]|nr:hypothetical protein [Agyrium rufum]